MYHLRLVKALSYTGVVEATKKKPDVYVEDKATADAAVATGYFKLLGSAEGEPEPAAQTGHLDRGQLEDMKLNNLKKLASEIGIDIAGFKKKADYVDAISAADVIPGEEAGEDNEVDYGEGSITMIDLQEQP